MSSTDLLFRLGSYSGRVPTFQQGRPAVLHVDAATSYMYLPLEAVRIAVWTQAICPPDR